MSGDGRNSSSLVTSAAWRGGGTLNLSHPDYSSRPSGIFASTNNPVSDPFGGLPWWSSG